jgi:diguanylate cyclase (GGDEF)-like protein/PAS domain S-box-containing protein
MTLAETLGSIIGAVSGRKRRLEVDLQESELRFRQVTEYIQEVLFLVDPGMTQMLYVSPGYSEIWGRSRESLYANPRSFMDAIHIDDRVRAINSFAPDGTVIPFDVEYRVVRPDGDIRWVRARGFPIRDENGEVYRFAGIAEDVTQRINAVELITRQAKALEQGNRRLTLLGEMTGLLQTVVRLEETPAIIGGYLEQISLSESGALYMYKESRNHLDLMARWGEQKVVDSFPPEDCWALRRGQAYRPPGMQFAVRCKHVQQAGGPAGYACLPMMAEGGALGLLYVSLSNRSETDENDVVFAQRMSEQLGLALANLRLREELRLEAIKDSLTGLFNRRFLESSLQREFARAAREKTSVAVAMLDVDKFKSYNDKYGHETGDAVLRQIGQALMENCRLIDLACRFGGDEFAVVFPSATRASMSAWAKRFLGKVRVLKVMADGRALPELTVSIGIAFFPEHGDETTEVIQAADRALYEAKQVGRDRYFFSASKPDAAGQR